MKRTLAVLAVMAGIMAVPFTAQAADPTPVPFPPQGCYLLGLPPGQTTVCPSPRPTGPTEYSVCTPIEPIGGLPRKSCQRFEIATNNPVGNAQIYVYAPANTLTPPPEPQVTPRAPYTAPAPAAAPVPSRIVPRVDTPRGSTPTAAPSPTGSDAGLITEPAGITTGAAPSTSAPFVPNGQGEPLNARHSNVIPLTIAGIAALFLLGACFYRPRHARKGSHRP